LKVQPKPKAAPGDRQAEEAIVQVHADDEIQIFAGAQV
jgi:hypothetical protein